MAPRRNTLLAAAVLLLAGSAAADTCSYCDGSGNRLSCYVASSDAPTCEWQVSRQPARSYTLQASRLRSTLHTTHLHHLAGVFHEDTRPCPPGRTRPPQPVQGNYKTLPSCFDSSLMWSSTGSLCSGIDDESRACPDSITADGQTYNLMAIRPWDGACPDPDSTEPECSGEPGCFPPPESEGVYVRKLLGGPPRRNLNLGAGAKAAQQGTDVEVVPRAGVTQTKELARKARP